MTNAHNDSQTLKLGGDDAQLLSDDQLDAIAGGMDCRTARKVSDAYIAAAMVMQSVGQDLTANGFYNKAAGVRQGGCG